MPRPSCLSLICPSARANPRSSSPGILSANSAKAAWAWGTGATSWGFQAVSCLLHEPPFNYGRMNMYSDIMQWSSRRQPDPRISRPAAGQPKRSTHEQPDDAARPEEQDEARQNQNLARPRMETLTLSLMHHQDVVNRRPSHVSRSAQTSMSSFAGWTNFCQRGPSAAAALTGMRHPCWLASISLLEMRASMAVQSSLL